MIAKYTRILMVGFMLIAGTANAVDIDGDGIDDEPPVTRADRACGTIICIMGEMMGVSGGRECNGYIDDYFDIRRYRHGVYSASRTARSRGRFLNRCDSPMNRANAAAINAAYGPMYDNPF